MTIVANTTGPSFCDVVEDFPGIMQVSSVYAVAKIMKTIIWATLHACGLFCVCIQSHVRCQISLDKFNSLSQNLSKATLKLKFVIEF